MRLFFFFGLPSKDGIRQPASCDVTLVLSREGTLRKFLRSFEGEVGRRMLCGQDRTESVGQSTFWS